jgi:predicted RecB family nuclease
MVGAWSAAAEARRRGVAMGQLELMREIERYNEVDCRVMQEVIRYLRSHH